MEEVVQDAILCWLQEHRDYFATKLTRYESGSWKTGRVVRGALVDQTPRAIREMKRRVAEIDRLLRALRPGTADSCFAGPPQLAASLLL
jgi:hypothetical protein